MKSYSNHIYSKNNFNNLIKLVENCSNVEQNKINHPEGDVLNHSLQVFKIALKESSDIDLILAALLHDVGKSIRVLDHEKYSCDLLKNMISHKTKWLILNHIRIKWFLNGEMKKLKKVKDLHDHEYFNDLILLHRWDIFGRNPNLQIKFNKDDILLIQAINNLLLQNKQHLYFLNLLL